MTIIKAALSSADIPTTISQLGVGLHWVWMGAASVEVYSTHPTGKLFIPTWNASGVGKTIEIQAPASPSSASLTLTISSSGAGGLDTGAVAQNTFYEIYLITKANGLDPALIATLAGSDPTIPAAYSGGYKSGLLWGLSCSFDLTGGTTYDDITPFQMVGPGECKYQTGGGGYVGSGLQVLSGGTAISSTAIDLSAAVPKPEAGTGHESRGVVYLKAQAQNTSTSSNINCDLYHSADGRTDADANDDDGLDSIFTFTALGKGSGGYRVASSDSVVFPNMVKQTLITHGFSSDATGTTANYFQYKFSGAADTRSLSVWVTGWKLNG